MVLCCDFMSFIFKEVTSLLLRLSPRLVGFVSSHVTYGAINYDEFEIIFNKSKTLFYGQKINLKNSCKRWKSKQHA